MNRTAKPRLPRRLFKFTEARFADGMASKGTISIGTFFDYRRDEHQPGVHDAEEGKAKVFEYIHLADARSLSPFARSAVRIPPTAHNIVLDRCVVDANIDNDAFVYCLSTEPDWACVTSPKYDARVEIRDVRAFIHALSSLLGGRVRDQAVGGLVDYGGRSRPWTPDMGSPAFFKDPSFAYQREWRVVWTPTYLPIARVTGSHGSVPMTLGEITYR